MNIIVTRHKGLVEWLRRREITGEVYEEIKDPEVIRGKDVYGALPQFLACQARTLTAVDIKVPLDKRSNDHTPEEMDKYGAKLSTYMTFKIPMTMVDDFLRMVGMEEPEQPNENEGHCKWCSAEIPEGDECDFCWELRTRAERNTKLATKIVSNILLSQS